MSKKKKDSESRDIKAIEDLADVIRKKFKKLTRPTRKKIWKKLVSDKGKKEMELLIINPGRSLNRIRSLYSERQDFHTWLSSFPKTCKT